MLDDAPEGWQSGTFGDIAKVKSGFAFKSKDFCDPSNETVSVIRMSDLKLGRVTWETAKNLPVAKVLGLERFQLTTGDFLFGMSGSLGNFGIVPKTEKPLYLNQRVGKLEPVGSAPSFLHHLFTSEQFLSEVVQRAAGNAQANISGKQIEGIEISIPPLTEQERIAEVLTSVDDSIHATEAVIAQAERVKRGLMEDLLTGGLGVEAISLGEVPKGWRKFRQGEVATFFNGRAYKLKEWEKSGTPVIRLQNLTGSGREYYYSTLKLPSHQYCDNGDLLFMWSASFGPYIWSGEKAIFHYHIWKIEHDTAYLSKWYHYYFLLLQTNFWKNDAHGMAMLHLTKGWMEKLEIAIPPIEQQKVVVERLKASDLVIASNSKTLNQLQRLKRGLMDDLLTGRVRTV